MKRIAFESAWIFFFKSLLFLILGLILLFDIKHSIYFLFGIATIIMGSIATLNIAATYKMKEKNQKIISFIFAIIHFFCATIIILIINKLTKEIDPLMTNRFIISGIRIFNLWFIISAIRISLISISLYKNHNFYYVLALIDAATTLIPTIMMITAVNNPAFLNSLWFLKSVGLSFLITGGITMFIAKIISQGETNENKTI